MKNKLIGISFAICILSFACKGIGMISRLYLASRMGSEGLGVYQLIMSAYSLFSSFASAGISVTVSHLASEKISLYGKSGGDGVKNTAFRIALFSGTVAAISLILLSPVFSSLMLYDGRTVLPLRILALSMPVIAMSSCLKGWFNARRKIIIPSSAQAFEELCKAAIIYIFLSFVFGSTNDISTLCIGVSIGLTLGEMLSFTFLFVFSRLYGGGKNSIGFAPPGDVIKYLLPVAGSSWLTNLLHTGENLLIPYCLTMYGGSEGDALSSFGIIRGMAIPIVFFPFAFISAAVSMLIPEISALNAASKSERDKKIQKALDMTSVFSMASGGMFFFAAKEISLVLYKKTDVVFPLKCLAVIVPFMYLETVSDGILKAIGEQKYTFRVTVYNCITRLVYIALVIPKTGSNGYLLLLIISNTFSFALCYGRILVKCKVNCRIIGCFAFPLISALSAGFICEKAVEFSGLCGIVKCCVMCGCFIAVYSAICAVVYKNGRKFAL